MGLFNFFKKPPSANEFIAGPYADSAINLVYHLLFCDNIELYKTNTPVPLTYPFDILYAETSDATNLQKIIDDNESDPRVKILACNRLLASGRKPGKKELFAVIVEIGLDNGLDVLASFNNGTARYINQMSKLLIWETTDEMSNQLTEDLFAKSRQIVEQIGPWDQPRRPHPAKGSVRISFLVSDGLYFGEAPVDVLFSDPLASPALAAATALLKYLTEKSLQSTGKK
jgi:hypothetical protein